MASEAADAADIVVVGFGGAGAATALRAAELGASVIILEKQTQEDHMPSTYLSGGVIFGVNDVQKATTYFTECAGGMVPRDVCAAWAEKALDIAEWLDAQGTDLNLVRFGRAEHPSLEGSESIEVLRMAKRVDGSKVELTAPDTATTGQVAAGGAPVVSGGPPLASGKQYFGALREATERSDSIRVLYGTPAQRLLTRDGDGVVGVLTENGQRIEAQRGVVLTCGGYEFDEEMKLNYLKAAPMHFYGNPANTGDGVRMAQDVGADLWHMNQMIGRAIGHFELDDGRVLNVVIMIAGGGYIITDKHGSRFANELSQAQLKHGFYYYLTQYDPDRQEYPRIPCYWFFDSRRMATAITTLRSGLVGAGYYEWSLDNSKELAAGWIKSSNDIEELAAQVGIDSPLEVKLALEAYNEACENGTPDAFERPKETMVALEPPFYCVPLYPGGSNTCGGPRKNAKAQVLDTFGDPIPGLFAAGELGEAVGLLYPADGSNLSESICFGRIAAETALGA